MSLACSTVRYSFRTSARTSSGALSSGGPHPPPPPLRRLTFSPRTSLSPPTLRATIGSRPCLKTMQVFGVPSVPPSTPQGGYLAPPTERVEDVRHRVPVRAGRRGTDRIEDAAFRRDDADGSEEAGIGQGVRIHDRHVGLPDPGHGPWQRRVDGAFPLGRASREVDDEGVV